MSLDRQCVAYPSGNLETLFPSIQHLDLSHNLFDSLADVAKITIQLSQLRILRLNGNHFISWDIPPDLSEAFSLITAVSLTFTLISPSTISILPRIFPAAEECSLAENSLCDEKLTFDHAWPSLQILDLSCNNFSSIPTISFPGENSSLCELNLSYNKISRGGMAMFKSIRILDLRYNKITTWTELDRLRSQFPKVTDLRLQQNPLIGGVEEDEIQAYIIGHWGGLSAVNNMKVSEKERVNAELYFMSKVSKGQFKDFDMSGSRWAELCEEYGAPVASDSIEKKNAVLDLTFVRGSKTESRKVPRGLTVQRLKLLVAKWYKIPIRKIELVSIDAEGRDIVLDDSLRELAFYDLDYGSVIHVR